MPQELLEYIDENLNIILQNPDSVLYLKPYDVGKKKALFAVVKAGEGVYKKIQITKEQSKMTFPYEPIYWLRQGPGETILKKFISFYNLTAFNTTNLEGFKYEKLENEKHYNIGIFATFSDGSAAFVEREKEKVFNKHGGIQSYIDLLKPYKEYNPKNDVYYVINDYEFNDDAFIIPELTEQQKVKKIKR